MVVRVDQVACKFQVIASDVVFDAVSQTSGVEERLALAVGNARPWLAIGVNAALKADFDLSNPAHADLVKTSADVGVAGA